MAKVLPILLAAFLFSCGSDRAGPSAHSIPPGWDPFLDTLEARTLHYFLETTPEKTGLAPDRWPSHSPSSIAAAGFALTAIPLAVERHLIPRDEAADRILSALQYLMNMPQGNDSVRIAGYRGLYYHFLTMDTGTRTWNCELSTVDTGLLMLGVLFCESYFSDQGRKETAIREVADSLYRRVDWRWAMDDTTGILMGWTPERGFHHLTWHGYNEALFLYLLALGSPTHPVPPAAWNHWTSTYTWARLYDEEYLQFAPLFGHQFTQCWIDMRGIKDDFMRAKGIDYFENSRRATYAQWKYVAANPKGWRGYSDTAWGLTACDGPKDTTLSIDGVKRRFIGYGARGVSSSWSNDDGTISPSAAGGSVAFAPEICIPALKAMSISFPQAWSDEGFRDAFNLTYVTPATPHGWFDTDCLGIDQGPIALMIANFRDEFVWKIMKKNPYVVAGLRRAGFSGGWLDRAAK